MTIKHLSILLALSLGCLAWVACIAPVHPDDFDDDDQAGDDDAADDDAGDDDTGGAFTCGQFCSWEDDLCVDWGAMSTSCMDFCQGSMDEFVLGCMEDCPPDPTSDGCNCLYGCFKE